ncbi:hypothetical protein PJF56_16405 [Roseofilum sp. BLCC_M91]|uniref:Uncharacterized protein n=1 Tax=Roseofilum halophilum BLCC-M91 TaxID=3022259 RepID=A0ABT7BMQ1_9CYAN|nr:hypothetical protein [Roseofilum halophilum]MDJ1180446.1 hypothetical protein [Roseofilum halophilum BLCC-M91]
MYSQFIYGKFVGSRSSEYQLVARSPDLTNEADLNTMAERTHRFWGSTPPEREVKAVGIFLHNQNLVLVKAETAVDDRGQFAVNGVRGFNQHRYVFIPIASISALQGRTFRLLVWILKQPIPLLVEFNAHLEPLSISLLEEPISAEIQEQEIGKIQTCLQYTDQQKTLLLSALAAIINGKQLLLTNEQTDIAPQNWMDSLLLLLPASIRPQISVAVGTLKEQECSWAQLVIKTNQHSSRSLPENMIWLNRATQTFQGQFDEDIFENRYVDYIRDHIAKAPDTLKQLIQKLDEIVEDDITLESLAEPKIIVRLIPALPEEQQDIFLSKYISGLTIEKWEEFIPPIIKEDYQQGLVFSWIELGKKAMLEAQAIPLMLQIWSRLENIQLVRLLDELNNNLTLAEILLREKRLLDRPMRQGENTIINYTLKSQPYQPSTQTMYSEGYDPDALSRISKPPPSSSSSSTVIVRKLIELCQKVVAHKAKSSWQKAWGFATNLATHKFFPDETEAFSLLDTALLGEISLKDLYNCFTLKLAILLPNIEVEQFKHSNLHRQLNSKNLAVADLLEALLAECNAGLANLPEIANLIEMDNAAKDNWYKIFLKKWSFSWEQAKLLLVEVIKDNQKYRNMFSRDELRQTYTWFEQQQPELKAIFDSLQQDYSCDNWVNLAHAIYQTQKEQTEFVDSLVGNIFPVAVMQKWLPLIADNDNLRKNFIATSSAWQSLTVEGFNQLVHRSQQYVPTLTRCLRDALRLSWIKGDLLHYLCQTWIRQKRIDEDLRNVITSPSVTNTFTTQDWLILQRLSWEPGIELNLELPLGVKTALTPEQKITLQMNAKTIVSRYNHPEQTRGLLHDCAGWGLELDEQKEILKAVQPSACNANLISPYLYREAKVINPAEEQQLIGLLLQLQLNDSERPDVEKFSVDVFNQYILPNCALILLKWWRDKAVEKQLYKVAFFTATQTYVQNLSITDFFNYLKVLKTHSLVEEAGWMFKATFSWIPDLLIQPIIAFIVDSTF